MKRINLKKKKHLRMQVLFLAPRTGLEPVTSQSAVMLPFAVPGKRRATPLRFSDRCTSSISLPLPPAAGALLTTD